MENGVVPLGGVYKGIYGANFCRNCREFLAYDDEKIITQCPKCKTKIDWHNKMVFVNGKWVKKRR